MPSSVVALNKTVRVADDRKAAFLDAVAQSYDVYVSEFDQTPDGIAYVMGGVFQTARVAHHVTGASASGASSFLALASVAITKDLIAPA